MLDSVVKERFDQVFRLNRGRAFYSSLSICQAVFRFCFRRNSFLLNHLQNLSFISSASVRRAFYSTSLLRQAVFEEVFLSSQPLALPINLASLVSGRRIIQRLKPLSTTSFNRFRSIRSKATNRTQPPPCQRGAFYSNPPPAQPFYLANLLIYKRFCLRTAPEVVRIIGT